MSNTHTGEQALMLGAIDSGISFAAGVPGYPVTGIMQLLMELNIEARWSVNEKVALEAALGASSIGRRAVVVIKHVGMNILADPLITSATHTIGAGVVIIVGDDPGARMSQNEQDSRYYGLIAEVPVFDPGNPEIAYICMRRGFSFSEKVHTPVIIRVNDRLNNMSCYIKRTKPSLGTFPAFDRNTWSYSLKGKHQCFHLSSYPLMKEASEGSDLNILHQRGSRIGIISSGYISTLVEDIISSKFPDISHLSLTLINPLPASLINDFIKHHSRVLVIEETEPVIEQQISCCGVCGKATGHIGYGKQKISDIIWALEHITQDNVKRAYQPETLQSRGFSRGICDDCPYHVLYKTLKKLKVIVAGDLGCSIRTAPPPAEVVDMAYSLGSSIAVATGFNEKGVALIGDFGFVHTGLQGLIEAVYLKKDVLVVVLLNRISALTGGQHVPDITGIVKSLVPETEILDMENISENKLLLILEAELNKNGVSVIIARGQCNKYRTNED
jgi:indolepyruvate ferredoxin oxidoreductase alpha subunit